MLAFGGTSSVSAKADRAGMAGAINAPWSSSARSSTERDSWRESGVAGSFERHSQGNGGDATATPLERNAEAGRAGPAGGATLAGLQQHAAHTRFRQHARALTAPVVDALASLPGDRNPRIAMRATASSRKWWGVLVMSASRGHCPNCQLNWDYNREAMWGKLKLGPRESQEF